MSQTRLSAVVVLAAGEGTRMKSATPKVLHTMLGRTLLGHVLSATDPLAAGTTLIVVGHGKGEVVEHVQQVAPSARVVEQAQQRGTGNAVAVALAVLPDVPGSLMVVCGDTPLLTSETLQRLCTVHDAEAAAATVLTSTPDNPLGYGRVVRGGDGGVAAIVEEADADARTRAVREVNSGIYVFDGGLLREALSKLSRDNSQGEEYLTDVVGILVRDGHRVAAATVDDANEVIGVNDRVQLANARKQMQNRINEHWMREGVSIIDPSTTMIGAGVTIEPEATIHPWTLLEGGTSVASGAAVGPGTQVIDTTVGPGAVIRFSVVDRADIGANAQVGPFTHLRPDTRLGEDARAGAFVETKNAQVGRGSKVPHLSYVGDADIGEGSNIGAATVFVNYDGVAKHHTHIGDHVRIGSDTMLVAPVSVGDGAYTAAGSVITDDVPPGAMGVGRARQRTILGWVLRKRAGTSSARAAEAAGDTPSTAGDNGAQGPKEGSPA